jgi:protein TonB
MKTQSEQVQRWDDIIFEKRNKDYGAYAIRKNYNDSVLKAEAISIGIGLLIFIVPILMQKEKALPVPIPDLPPIVLEQYRIEPAITPPSTPAPPRRMDASIIPTQVVTTPVVDEPVTQPPTDEVSYTTGPDTGTSGETGVDVTIGTGTYTEPVVEAPVVFTYVEKMPEYEGGYEAMYKFLRKHVKYPRRPQQAGREGTVYVKFIVAPDGTVTNVEIEKGFDKECDAEAVRVISLMNKWHAGIQNGLPVPVRKILPITFKLNI